VFHFLADAAARDKYVNQVTTALRPAGFLLVATFAMDGPATCSGLTVERYSVETLVAQFGRQFTLVTSRHEMHHTPLGGVQSFVYALLRRTQIA
jgi:hypothetical protein